MKEISTLYLHSTRQQWKYILFWTKIPAAQGRVWVGVNIYSIRHNQGIRLTRTNILLGQYIGYHAEQPNIQVVTGTCNWLMVAASSCVQPLFQCCHLVYETEIRSIYIAWPYSDSFVRRLHLHYIPEQFTVKAHPALFGGGVSHKKESTIIPVYSWHTFFKTCTKHNSSLQLT